MSGVFLLTPTFLISFLTEISNQTLLQKIDGFFGIFVEYLAKVLFFKIIGFPLIVLVLLIGAITFTFYFRFRYILNPVSRKQK